MNLETESKHMIFSMELNLCTSEQTNDSLALAILGHCTFIYLFNDSKRNITYLGNVTRRKSICPHLPQIPLLFCFPLLIGSIGMR